MRVYFKTFLQRSTSHASDGSFSSYTAYQSTPSRITFLSFMLTLVLAPWSEEGGGRDAPSPGLVRIMGLGVMGEVR